MSDHHVAVIGLGYVGLPLALDLHDAGFDITAVDASEDRVERLRGGGSYVDDVPDARLHQALRDGRLKFISVRQRLPHEATVAFLCVPTPVTASQQPDLGPVLAAAEYVLSSLKPGDLIILQSTTYPGTTVGPLRRVLESGGLRAGTDFALAFAPERISPGDGRPAASIPRLVGGIDDQSRRRAAAILRTVAPSVTEMSSPDAAELAKLFENVFRNVNIALVNELALMCERLGLDVWEIIEAASTKPFGFMPFYPGPGVGGHCIPVDPYYLSARAREVGFHERFIWTAGDINSQMPGHVQRLVVQALNARGKALKGANILVVGVAFKAGVSDARNSPAGPIITGLGDGGATVSFHDPLLPEFNPWADQHQRGPERGPDGSRRLQSVDLEDALRAEPDCVVIVTPHRNIDWGLIFERADLVVDARNVSRSHSVRPGQVLRLGAGWS